MRVLSRPPALLRNVYSGAVWRVKNAANKIYITFDDGPVPGVTPAALAVLREHNVKATFFCVGDNVRKHPDVFQQVIADGHSVGNHTFNHADGWKYSTRDYLKQVQLCKETFASTLFRPPYGRMRRSQFKAIKRKYKVVMWDVLTCDFDRTLSPEEVLKIAVEKTRAGSVIVFHDSIKAEERMLYALPKFIVEMKQKGFEFGTL